MTPFFVLPTTAPTQCHKTFFSFFCSVVMAIHFPPSLIFDNERGQLKESTQVGSKVLDRGVQNLTGESFKVVWAEFSTLS
jgi:hypothetical protein